MVNRRLKWRNECKMFFLLFAKKESIWVLSINSWSRCTQENGSKCEMRMNDESKLFCYSPRCEPFTAQLLMTKMELEQQRQQKSFFFLEKQFYWLIIESSKTNTKIMKTKKKQGSFSHRRWRWWCTAGDESISNRLKYSQLRLFFYTCCCCWGFFFKYFFRYRCS